MHNTNSISIPVITGNQRIWDKPTVMMNIISASMKYEHIYLDLKDEAPCCEAIGIDAMLDDIIAEFNFDPAKYNIITGNMISSSKFNEKIVGIKELPMASKMAQEKLKSDHISNILHTIGIFIGRSNWQRLGLASYIWNNCNNPQITFHYDHTSDYHINHLGLEELLHKHWDDKDNINKFLDHVPIKDDTVFNYPILWYDNAFDMEYLYNNLFCDVICETFYDGKTFLFTEKTMRCIINKKPFIVQGPKWFLKNLKRLGFKTFDNWWDEGYDQDPSDARYETVKQNISYISSQPMDIINKWYNEMNDILHHNLFVLANLTNEKVLDTEFYYE